MGKGSMQGFLTRIGKCWSMFGKGGLAKVHWDGQILTVVWVTVVVVVGLVVQR